MNFRLKLQKQSTCCFKGDDSMNILDSKGMQYLRTNFKLVFLVLSVSHFVSHSYKIAPIGDKMK